MWPVVDRAPLSAADIEHRPRGMIVTRPDFNPTLTASLTFG
jgi:hypothetical protein